MMQLLTNKLIYLMLLLLLLHVLGDESSSLWSLASDELTNESGQISRTNNRSIMNHGGLGLDLDKGLDTQTLKRKGMHTRRVVKRERRQSHDDTRHHNRRYLKAAKETVQPRSSPSSSTRAPSKMNKRDKGRGGGGGEKKTKKTKADVKSKVKTKSEKAPKKRAKKQQLGTWLTLSGSLLEWKYHVGL